MVTTHIYNFFISHPSGVIWMLTPEQIIGIVHQSMIRNDTGHNTQELLDSGEVPRLRGYTVRPGKVSDSIFGGEFAFKRGAEVVHAENPPLTDRDGTPVRIMVRTDRISTHDIIRGTIPFKDQVLAANHHAMLQLAEPYIGSSQYTIPGLTNTSVVIAAEDLIPIPLEMVLRAYMAKSTTETSLYQHWMRGEGEFCGHALPEWLIPNGPLPYIMDTPSTKSEEHDESLSAEDLVTRGICTHEEYVQIRNGALAAYGAVSQFLRSRGIILVDTKTEHGTDRDGRITGMDEMFTMDSSRFWLSEDYAQQYAKFERGEIEEINPRSFSKEFARGFSQGKDGYTDEQRSQIAVRYIQGIQHLLGIPFQPDERPRDERVVTSLQTVVDYLGI